MTIPTLKSYSDYTFIGACEHPGGFYVAAYRQTSTFGVSTPHTWRLSVFDNTSPYAETDTDTFTYASQWCNSGIPICSSFDDTIWIRHSAHGINSFSISATGTFTLINFYGEDSAGAGWISDITESEDYIWVCHYSNFVGAFTKTAAGTITAGAGGVLLETASVFSNSTDLKLEVLHYNDDYDSIIMIQKSGNDDKAYCYDATTFAFNWSKEYPGGLPSQRYKTDSRALSYPDSYQSRNSNVFRVAWDADSSGSVEMTEDELAADAYATLVAGHEPIFWADFNEAAGFTKFRDQSGSKYDLTPYGTWLVEQTALFNTHNNAANKSIDSNNVAYAETSSFINMNTLSNYSFECLVKLNANDSNYVGFMVCGNGSGYWLGVGKDTANKIYVSRYDTANRTITSPSVMELGRVYHVVYTFDDSVGSKLYIDGVLIGTDSATADIGVSSTYLTIGQTPTNGNVLDWNVDAAIIYDKTLVQSEVVALFNEGADDPYADTLRGQMVGLGPLSYWPCDDAGGAVLDVVGGQHFSPSTAGCSFLKSGIPVGGTSIETDGAADTLFLSPAISDFNGMTKWSFEFWMYWYSQSAPTGDFSFPFRFQLSDGGSGIDEYLNFGFKHSTKWPYFQQQANSSNTYKYLRNDYGDAKFHHMVFSVDTTNNLMKWYIDGSLIQTLSGTLYAFAQAMYISLGNGYTSGADWPCHVKFQHVALYDKILTQTNITDNYLLGMDHTPTADNDYEQLIIDDEPVLYYPMDDLTGTGITDRMGNFDAILVGDTANNLTDTGICREDAAQPSFNFTGGEYGEIRALLPVGNYPAFTAEIVCRPDTTVGSIEPMGSANTDSGWFLQYDDNVINSGLWAIDTARANLTKNPSSNPQPLTFTDRVQHVMIVWDGTNFILYNNGVKTYDATIGSVKAVDYTVLTHLRIAAGFGVSNLWKGNLAHMAFYNKALLRADAVKRTQLLNGYDVANFPTTSVKSKIYADSPRFFLPMDELNTADNVRVTELMCENTIETQVSYESVNGTEPTLRATTFLDDGFDTHCRSFRSGQLDYLATNSLFRDDTEWNTSYTHGWTFEIFFQTSATPSANDENTIIHLEQDSSHVTKFRVSTGTTGQIFVSGSASSAVYGSGYNDGLGHHLVVVYNGLATPNGRFAVYLDGILIGTLTDYIGYEWVDRAWIGMATGSTDGFVGNLVNFASYNSELAVADIRDHYATAFGMDVSSTDDYSDIVIPDAPIAFYRMDDATDSDRLIDRMNAFHGTSTDILFQQVSGIATVSTNKSASFDGVSSFGYVPSQIISNSDDFSVEVWFKFGSASDELTIHRGKNGLGAGVSLTLIATTTSIELIVTHTVSTTASKYITAGVSVSLNGWHHLVVTWEQGVGTEMWFNGLKIGDNAFTDTVLRDSSYGWGIGQLHNGGAFKSCRYDELAIYDRVITPTEILEHFYEGAVVNAFDRAVIDDSPYAWWSFEGDSKSTDDTFRDRFGVHNGSWGNTATDAAHACRLGSTTSAYFPTTGGNGYLEFDTDAHFTTDLSSTLTVECWIEFSLYDVASAHCVVINDGGSGDGWSIQTYNGWFGLWVRQSSTGISAVVLTERIPQNVPVHVVGVIYSGGLKLYINGVLQATTSATITDIEGAQAARIGRLGSSNQSPASGSTSTTSSWEGYLDDIIIYDGELSANRVEAHFNAGCPLNSNLKTIMKYSPTFYMPCDDQLSSGALEVMTGVNWTHQDTVDEADGYVGRAYYLDGDTQTDSDSDQNGHYIHSAIDGSGVAHINEADSHTFCAWVKLGDRGTNQNQELICQYRRDPHHQVYYTFNDPDGNGATITHYLTTPNSGAIVSTSTTRMPYDEWAHVAFVVTLSGGLLTCDIYLNGTEVSYSVQDSSAFVSTDYSTSYPWAIGETISSQTGKSYYHLEGYLDELIWYPFAMTSAQITEIYNATGTEYKIFGAVKQDGVAVERDVHLYRQDTGELMLKTTSVGGAFDIRWKYLDPVTNYFVVVFDDAGLPLLQPITQDRLQAVEVV